MPEAATEKVAGDPAVTVRLEGCVVIVGAVAAGGGVDGAGVLLLSLPQPERATQSMPANNAGDQCFRRRRPVLMSMAIFDRRN